jgi:hemerythrin-like domain-containing protein
MELKNSEIRELLLKDHEALRAALSTLEADLARVATGGAESTVKVRDQLHHVLDVLRAHSERSLRLLKPVIVDLDAWGPLRAEQIDKEHEELHDLATRFASIDVTSDSKRWVEEVKGIIAHLREELAEAEQGRLSPEVLRDDVIRVDFGG